MSDTVPPQAQTPTGSDAKHTLPPESGRVPGVRWTICALLFFATTINYIDRSVFSLLAPSLQKSIGWNEISYSNIITAFQTAYALGLVIVGRLIDRIGVRKGYASVITVWSTAAMSHSLAGSVMGFGLARFALGLGESGNFPVAIKAVAEWFPRRERALATGIFNAGSNIGAVIAPLFVPWVALHFGWRYAFLCTGILSAIWLVLWLKLYRRPEDHPRMTPQELAWIRSDDEQHSAPVPWLKLINKRQTWAFVVGKCLTDPIWWFYLFWLPKFLNQTFGLDLEHLGPPLVVIYIAADIGSVGGGFISSALMRKGWTCNASRKTALLVCALSVVPIVFVTSVQSVWIMVVLTSLATAAHQGWSANLYTLVSDTFPKQAVASVVGIGGMAGAVGGALFAKLVGYILQWTHSYLLLFVIAGSMYLLALAIIQLLVPRLDPANFSKDS
jgi:MFS transporter, ACS family, hexuronate transporter